MILKLSPYLLSTILYLMFSGCTQRSTTQKVNNPPVEIKKERAVNLVHEQSERDTVKGSIKSEAAGRIGSGNIRIMYHSPAVRGRVVWGGLVPYGQVWVTGAHSATSLETDRELTIDGKKLPAGKHAFFTIPGKEEWIVIINKNWQQHLADNYSDKDDLIRLRLKPQILQQNQERLRYQLISETSNKGMIVFTWEKIKIEVPIGQ